MGVPKDPLEDHCPNPEQLSFFPLRFRLRSSGALHRAAPAGSRTRSSIARPSTVQFLPPNGASPRRPSSLARPSRHCAKTRPGDAADFRGGLCDVGFGGTELGKDQTRMTYHKKCSESNISLKFMVIDISWQHLDVHSVTMKGLHTALLGCIALRHWLTSIKKYKFSGQAGWDRSVQVAFLDVSTLPPTNMEGEHGLLEDCFPLQTGGYPPDHECFREGNPPKN